MNRKTLIVASGLSVALSCAGAVFAQANYVQSFENVGAVQPGQHGPANLIAEGWIFRNQSNGGAGPWHQAPAAGSGIPPQDGAGYMGVDSALRAPFSTWAILPALQGQQAGDYVRFYVQGRESSSGLESMNTERIQLRYSPAGGTGTGSSLTDVGDFTVLLAEVLPRLYVWEPIEVQAPGPGRLAIRYVKPQAGSMTGAPYVRVDGLSVTGTIVHPPIPAPGETVHWTSAASPHVIDFDMEIPAGGTVIVDPGARVIVEADWSIAVRGRLEFAGEPGARCTVTGENSHSQIASVGGSIEARHTDFDVQIGADIARFTYDDAVVGTGTYADCTFGPFGWFHDAWLSFISMERCAFDTTYGPIFSNAVRLVDVTSNQSIKVQGAVLVSENVTVNGAAGQSELDGVGFNIGAARQPTFVSGLTATNNAQAGLYLAGGRFLVGPDNVIAGNRVAVELGGGLMAGSVIPAAGNADNGFISVGHSTRPQFGTMNATAIDWEDIGLPYYVGDNWLVGPAALTIREGVDVRLGLDAIISTEEFGQIKVEGRPGNPATFAALDAARPWHSIAFATWGNRITDADISGSKRGVSTFLGLHVDLLNSQVHHNEHGGVRGVRARKTAFRSNSVAGVSNIGSTLGSAVPDLSSATNPNIFERNAYGVIDYFNGGYGTIDASYSWWGSPTGPRAPSNPGGAGDRVFGSVVVDPFLDDAPDESDHPPVVELSPIDYIEPLNKVTLHWTAGDDRGIVSQRVAYRNGSDGDRGFTVVAELPPHQRSFEWTPPEVGMGVSPYTFVRVIAVDTLGQEGYSQLQNYVPDAVRPGTVTITPDLAGRVFRPTDLIDIDVAWSGFDEFVVGQPDIYLELISDDHAEYVSATYTPGAPLSRISAPAVSTDQARLVAVPHGTYNRAKFFFTEPFAIRPDPRIGDAPPAITLTAPADGQSLAAGSDVTVAWTASDDNGVRWVKVYASYDAGRTWQRLADRLPGPSGSYTWRLAPGDGYADVRIRAVAVDSRFQNTSDTTSVAITPGSLGPACDGIDFNGDGLFPDNQDLVDFLAVFGGGACSNEPNCGDLDFNNDGLFPDNADIEAMFRVFGGGAC